LSNDAVKFYSCDRIIETTNHTRKMEQKIELVTKFKDNIESI